MHITLVLSTIHLVRKTVIAHARTVNLFKVTLSWGAVVSFSLVVGENTLELRRRKRLISISIIRRKKTK